jgi:hypothetical protein
LFELVRLYSESKIAEKGAISDLLSKQGLFTRQMSIVKKQIELSKESLSIDGENKDNDESFGLKPKKKKSAEKRRNG